MAVLIAHQNKEVGNPNEKENRNVLFFNLHSQTEERKTAHRSPI